MQKILESMLGAFVLVCSWLAAVRGQGGMTVSLSEAGVEVLAGPLLRGALGAVEVEAVFERAVPCGQGACTVAGSASGAAVTCSETAVQTVPIGVNANASLCSLETRVQYTVHRGDASGPVLCSNASASLRWTSPRITVYVAVAPNSTSGGLRISSNRVEVAESNATLPLACADSVSVFFISQAIANAVPGVLDPLLAALAPAPMVHIPELPENIALNMSVVTKPTIRPANLSVSFNGRFMDMNDPSVTSGVSCDRSVPPGNPNKDGVVDFGKCFFNSLGAVLFASDVLEETFKTTLGGIDVSVNVRCEQPPVATFSYGSSGVNTTLRLSFDAFGSDQGDVLLSVTLPTNISASGSTLRASIPPNVNVTNLSIKLDGFKLPINATILEPLMADFLDTQIIPAINKLLDTGITVGVPLKSDIVFISPDGVQFEFDFSSNSSSRMTRSVGAKLRRIALTAGT